MRCWGKAGQPLNVYLIFPYETLFKTITLTMGEILPGIVNIFFVYAFFNALKQLDAQSQEYSHKDSLFYIQYVCFTL